MTALQSILRPLFRIPGVLLIEGEGKVGKTNFGLFLTEQMQKLPINVRSQKEGGAIMNLIESKADIATNIDTLGFYEQISDSVNLRQWMFGNNHRKCYVMDEANEYLTNLRVMSSLNVGFTRLLPQVTKAHCRMIIIGHDFQGIDKNILRRAWCKGMIVKTGLKTADVISSLFSQRLEIEEIPRTTVTYHPYELAPFTETPEKGIYFKDEDKQKLWDLTHGKTGKDLGLHPMQVCRLKDSFIKKILESENHVSHT